MRGLIDQLSVRDITTLCDVVGMSREELVDIARRKPWHFAEMLADASVVDSILDRRSHPSRAVSPALLFGVLVAVTVADLADATYVNDWVGPSSRLPVFDVEPLQEFIGDLGRITFLTSLLASFATPSPPPVPANPFDLQSMAAWLDQVNEPDRARILRRLGDLALFMTGVFPDRTGSRPLRPVDAERFGRSIGMTSDEILALCDPVSLAPGLNALEALGRRWYEASDSGERVVLDIAGRFTAARRVLNHLADTHLYRLDLAWPAAG